MDETQNLYTVEFKAPFNGVVYYENVMACSIEEAKINILERNPGVMISAVSIISKEIDQENNVELEADR